MGDEFFDYALESVELPVQVIESPAAELVMSQQRTHIRSRWTHTTRSTYPVPGSTADEMCNFFQDKVRRMEEWALFRFKIRWESLKTRGTNIHQALFIAESSITMPRWRALRSQPPEIQSDWNRMYANLLRHERSHVQKFRIKFNSEIRRLRHKAAMKKHYLTSEEIDAELSAIVTACQQDTDQYDADTDYGKKEGVVLHTCISV